jgi:hypothetical protein
VTTFETTYTFGKETKFNVGIFDEVKKSGKSLSMGSTLFEMGDVMGSRGSIKAKKLKGGGTVYVRVAKASSMDFGSFHLQIRGIKLKNVDGMFSKSDPFFIVQAQSNDAGGRVWQPVYRSDPVQNDLNPMWKEFSIPMEKLCGGDKDHCLQIEVWDWEKSGKHQVMGKVETTVNGLTKSVVMGLSPDPKKVPLTSAFKLAHKGKKYGNIVVTKAYISGENLTPSRPQTVGAIMNPGQAPAHAPGSAAPKKFIKINAVTKINPEWKAWKAAQTAAAPAPAFAASSEPAAGFSAALDVPPPGQQTAHSAPAFGAALDAPPQNQQLPSDMAPPMTARAPATTPRFVDYISGGTEMNLVVAIDFTGSNGDPRKHGTLHYIHRDGQLNDYEKALTAVGSIVARYDSDQMFPVLGFGAKYGGVIQHCFQVGSAPELKGVQGMVEGYRSVFKTGLTMSGPTVFAEAIQYAASQAQSQQDASSRIGKQSYTILLILTDGAVTDVEQTKQAIRQASSGPLSIVIVGIGNADFSTMQFLDDFQQAEGGRTRDIVQFVEFSRHRQSRQALTRETLDEIPDQLVSYFHGKGIMPLKPVAGSKLNIFEEDYSQEEDIDLAIDINEEGDITLANNAPGATWDGQSYGTASNFLPPAMAPPSAYGAPPAAASYQPAAQHHGGSSYGYSTQNLQQPATQSSYGASNGAYAPAGGTSYGAYAPTGGGGAYAPAGGGGAYAPAGGGGAYAPAERLPVQHSAGRVSVGGLQTAPVGMPSMIHIQAPPGSYPGMQLRVQNPATGQLQIVTIPNGVQPGAAFAVQL